MKLMYSYLYKYGEYNLRLILHFNTHTRTLAYYGNVFIISIII